MSRGQLDETTLRLINDRLPAITNIQGLVLSLSPDFISIRFDQESTVPIAAVCLSDTITVIAEARFALHEALACLIWYRERSDTPNEATATFLGRFYADDAAMRLYAAQEHLAYAIIAMLEISDEDVEQYAERRVSQASIVGNYLRAERPNHPITQAASQLFQSAEWLETMEYRGRLVHEQPPLVEGLGIVWRRYRRWHNIGDGAYLLGIGGGDEPEYSVDDLLNFMQPALFHFAQTLTDVLEFYINLLDQHGITLDRTRGTLTV